MGGNSWHHGGDAAKIRYGKCQKINGGFRDDRKGNSGVSKRKGNNSGAHQMGRIRSLFKIGKSVVKIPNDMGTAL